ncbi:MAG: type II toxin-antitoxin system CcdA family antitoxin [Alphaproteobacteria bacterium]|nr:type II toxin-antitoxin system CcdA family antitoxin [Alphaproteobacteria bacterium]
MNALYDPKAPKKACNVSINADLLAQAKALGINLSQLLESELESRLREAKAAAWAEENKAAIESQTRWIEKHGLLSDHYRFF